LPTCGYDKWEYFAGRPYGRMFDDYVKYFGNEGDKTNRIYSVSPLLGLLIILFGGSMIIIATPFIILDLSIIKVIVILLIMVPMGLLLLLGGLYELKNYYEVWKITREHVIL